MAELKLTEEDIKSLIKEYIYCRYTDEDVAVHFEIGNKTVSARVCWEENIKRDEQNHGQFDDCYPFGC